ncbi:MAG: methyltransferase type 11 [Ignavibacteriae bacterium]|nr:MAG: methyltransferase type 11 [Ignavibacteriota bacterium]
MSETIKYDEDWSQRLIKLYSTPDVIKQRKIVLSKLNLQPNDRILDIGSGPGHLIEDMAKIVDQRGSICGIEISAPFIALSQKICSHLSQVEIREGDATSIPYENEEFDVAVSTQVYEYIEDVDTCLNELFRVLKPGGRATIICTDWDTLIWNTENKDRMQQILTTFETHCADPRLPRKIVPKLRNIGFIINEYDVYTIVNPEYNENTYSHGIIDFIASYVSGKNGITEEKTKDWADELRKNGEKGTYFFSINRYIFVVSKPNL